ncbi:hypothetical protein PCE1_000716 [Barthelona sp. PCE]
MLSLFRINSDMTIAKIQDIDLRGLTESIAEDTDLQKKFIYTSFSKYVILKRDRNLLVFEIVVTEVPELRFYRELTGYNYLGCVPATKYGREEFPVTFVTQGIHKVTEGRMKNKKNYIYVYFHEGHEGIRSDSLYDWSEPFLYQALETNEYYMDIDWDENMFYNCNIDDSFSQTKYTPKAVSKGCLVSYSRKLLKEGKRKKSKNRGRPPVIGDTITFKLYGRSNNTTIVLEDNEHIVAVQRQWLGENLACVVTKCNGQARGCLIDPLAQSLVGRVDLELPVEELSRCMIVGSFCIAATKTGCVEVVPLNI